MKEVSTPPPPPQSQIKALSLLSASAFQAPARMERRLTLQLSVSQCHRSERSTEDRWTDGGTDRQECHKLSRAGLSELDEELALSLQP